MEEVHADTGTEPTLLYVQSFAMAYPHRNWCRPNVGSLYRFRYNGMEEDLGGNLFGNTYSTMFHPLDARLGRWWSPDPVIHPWESPYAGMGNNPVSFVDLLGLNEASPLEPEGTSIWEDISSGFNSVVGAIGSTISDVGNAIGSAARAVGRTFSDLADGLKELLASDDFTSGRGNNSRRWDEDDGPIEGSPIDIHRMVASRSLRTL